MKWGQCAINLKRSEVCLPCLGLADALIKLFGMIETTHLSYGFHLVWKLFLVCGKTFPQLQKWGRFAFVERHHLFWKLFRWNVKFKGKQHHWPWISRFNAHGFPEIQLQQRQPIILLPLRLICHDEFTFCKDKDYHRQYKVKHKINHGFFASFFPYCSLFARAWFKSSFWRSGSWSFNQFLFVRAWFMSPSAVSSVLFLSPFNSFPPQPPNPLLLNLFPPSSLLLYFGGWGGPKVGGGSGQRLTTWTAVEEENDGVGQATDKLWGRKVGVVVMCWCWNEGMRMCKVGWKMRWKTMKKINKRGEKWSKNWVEINKS